MSERKIYVQPLYELVECKKKVDPWDLTEVAKNIYLSSKVIGIKNTKVFYQNTKRERIEKYGVEIPIEARAIVGLIVKMIGRWTDDNSGRLEQHLGLPMTINCILGDTRIFSKRNTGLEIITIQDMIDRYLSK